jgi:hypothetical protein
MNGSIDDGTLFGAIPVSCDHPGHINLVLPCIRTGCNQAHTKYIREKACRHATTSTAVAQVQYILGQHVISAVYIYMLPFMP